ncbi:hypothetical protein Aeqsu_0874 [Aequorivita sublithincola DSM 14238]|uniref:Peptidase M43 pregnancy-associated plasma-A domain-containing protein n=1 Tax=Aequorivita sublithincola (strain DSM 14238 / LMG 21431 / ACAM 643 / 9-3) TaxID=746697 RepID=I3YTQ9_AEQSU|nr:hypothetical protein [Aequorivita sublithincola]AFL80377.1 hypothetical protein Aeqsu_0874 [Aequorivita sublithincola DSM 14238]
MNAQLDNPCATPDGPTADQAGAYSYSDEIPTLENFTPVVFNVFFWGINKSDGTSQYPLTENTVLSAVSKLNIQFNPFGIFFKYYGMDFFDSDTYYIIDRGLGELDGGPNDPGVYVYAASNNYKKADAFNIYVPYSTEGFAGAAELKNKVNIAINGFSLINSYSLLSHEIGHCFNLGHTFDGFRSPDPYCEHVTRDETDPDYNAALRGDRITDTAAVPDFKNEHFWELIDLGYTYQQALAMYIPYKYVDPVTYEYTGTGTDCLDPPVDYDISPTDVKNTMGYGPAAPPYAKKFTTGQKIRIHESIEIDYFGEFGTATTTFAALYEPYKGSYPPYYPHPQPWPMPMFQPGFTYDFIECCCEYIQPAAYGDLTFSVDPSHVVKHVDKFMTIYSSIYHPNHSAIVIHEIDQAFGTSSYQKCYDNYQTPPVLGGRVVRFNDNIFNENVTITPKDSTEITDPHLIENLDTGLYKIETNYGNGVDEETVIYKTGN